MNVPAEERLCQACQIGEEYGPEARLSYLRDLSRKGARASLDEAAERGLDVDALPAL